MDSNLIHLYKVAGMKNTAHKFCTAAAAMGLGFSARSFGSVMNISITNGDFENPVIAEFDQSVPTITGWSSDGSLSGSGTKKDPYFMSPGFNALALRAGDASVYQTTTWTIHDGDVFTVSLYLKNFWNSPGYNITLYALNSDSTRTTLDGTQGVISSSFYTAVTFSYTATASAAGNLIGIEIDAIGNPSDDSWMAADNVALTVDSAATVPEPASFALLAAACAALLHRRPMRYNTAKERLCSF